MTVDENAKVVWDYMHMNMRISKADAIFVLCSHDTRVAERAVELWKAGYAPFMIFSGGFGTVTSQRFEKPEARVFADIAIAAGVHEEAIIIEDASKNTGENVRFTYQLLERLNVHLQSVILVQKPYMERRTYATFMKQWPDTEIKVSVTSPQTAYGQYFDESIDKGEVLNIIVGDLQRIKEYPRLGYQIEQEISGAVDTAYKELIAAGYDKHLIKF